MDRAEATNGPTNGLTNGIGARAAEPSATAAAGPDGAATAKPALEVVMANPRGFCAGVERAIQIVERALEKFGAPVYVRHEIVHNRYVVETLEEKGAVFVEELDEVPDDMPVVFSAHGVPKSVPEEASRRKLFYVDATCPLVSKVHREAERHHRDGRQVILIGHAGHPEVVGTMGQLPDGAVVLVESVEDVGRIDVSDPDNLAFVTQTTLSVDDTSAIVDALQARFPSVAAPRKEDICYATTNRQQAVKAISRKVDAILVIGAPNSSNSMRLVEVARTHGCERAALVQRAADIDWAMLDGATRLGVTAGASAPEVLVEEVVAAIRERYDVSIADEPLVVEDVVFKMPRALAEA
ncbi:MAG: 4-hydroxy-3-methylbut-2-enyl diphosphate reductase [Azospirillaceae bacterium]